MKNKYWLLQTRDHKKELASSGDVSQDDDFNAVERENRDVLSGWENTCTFDHFDDGDEDKEKAFIMLEAYNLIGLDARLIYLSNANDPGTTQSNGNGGSSNSTAWDHPDRPSSPAS